MNAVLSYKFRSKTLSDGIISRKNDENLIGQIVENDTRNLKFILFHADIYIQIFKPILRKIE